ncbi:protein of unknown function [Methylococcus capsulatus]|uniref:Uncharacterized protein n=1 Tax=Methylococcus capsulatus TaxID=414 RepID=A0AA35UAY3_METCP|nr:protein of unknown function [Methylococcus capsulatus]
MIKRYIPITSKDDLSHFTHPMCYYAHFQARIHARWQGNLHSPRATVSLAIPLAPHYLGGPSVPYRNRLTSHTLVNIPANGKFVPMATLAFANEIMS